MTSKNHITTIIKLTTSPARLAQVFAAFISIILCVYNIMRELANCSQSQGTVQSMVSRLQTECAPDWQARDVAAPWFDNDGHKPWRPTQ